MAYEGQPGKAFVDLEIVQTHLRLAADYVAQAAAESFLQGNEGVLRYTQWDTFDSPLEVLFWIWWNAATGDGFNSELFELRGQHEVNIGGQLYRVDFLIEPVQQSVASSPEWKPIAVEVDGHAFHERTREQVAIRDSRDRALQAAGWRVFHFSFDEFTRQPLDSVAEVFMFAKQQWLAATKTLSDQRADRRNDHPVEGPGI